MKVPKVDIKQLLEAGVHLGHKTLRWNPKMKRFIFGEKNSIHIIDLTQTVDFIKNALVQVHKTISNGGKLLIVSTANTSRLGTAYEGLNFFKTGISHINTTDGRPKISKAGTACIKIAEDGFNRHCATSGLKFFKAYDSKVPTQRFFYHWPYRPL